MDAEDNDLSAEHPDPSASSVPTVNPGARQNRALRVSPTAMKPSFKLLPFRLMQPFPLLLFKDNVRCVMKRSAVHV